MDSPVTVYLWFGVACALFVYGDCLRRDQPAIRSLALGAVTIALPFALLPYHLARRPLLPGETRAGGATWNLLKYFALVWTALWAILTGELFVELLPAAETGEESDRLWSRAVTEQVGTYLTSWFMPAGVALVLGVALKDDAMQERG